MQYAVIEIENMGHIGFKPAVSKILCPGRIKVTEGQLGSQFNKIPILSLKLY